MKLQQVYISQPIFTVYGDPIELFKKQYPKSAKKKRILKKWQNRFLRASQKRTKVSHLIRVQYSYNPIEK